MRLYQQASTDDKLSIVDKPTAAAKIATSSQPIAYFGMALQYIRKSTTNVAEPPRVQVTPSTIGPRFWLRGSRTFDCPAMLYFLAFRDFWTVEITSTVMCLIMLRLDGGRDDLINEVMLDEQLICAELKGMNPRRLMCVRHVIACAIKAHATLSEDQYAVWEEWCSGAIYLQ